MKIEIKIQHWHESDGFSRDDGWEATAHVDGVTIRENHSTEIEALEAIIERLGMDVTITKINDSYTAY